MQPACQSYPEATHIRVTHNDTIIILYQWLPWPNLAMGHTLLLHFGVDEHPFASYFDVYQGRVLTHSQLALKPPAMAFDEFRPS